MRGRLGVALIGAAGAFAIAASQTPYLPLVILFTTLSLVCLAFGIWNLGGFPCKERLSSAARFCLRCLGFYSGFVISVALSTLWSFYFHPLPSFSTWGIVLLFLLAFILDLPTMYQGFKRRRYGEQVSPKGWLLFINGFLVGLSALLVFLAINSLVQNLSYPIEFLSPCFLFFIVYKIWKSSFFGVCFFSKKAVFHHISTLFHHT